MRCPNCNYEHGTVYNKNEKAIDVVGTEGEFWQLEILLHRGDGYYTDCQQSQVHGCPNCKIVFLKEMDTL